MMNADINLLIADDHEIFRDGLKLMLSKHKNIHLMGEAANGKELIALAEKQQPDVILTDIKMPLIDGIEAAKHISHSNPGIGIIGLSMYDEDNVIVEMLEAGALGYILKNAEKEQILEAIETVFMGKNYYCPTTSNKLLSLISKSKFNPAKKREVQVFSDKEIEIIQLIYKQKTAKEIAEKIFLSHRTIEGLKQKIMEKMGVCNNVGIAIYAMKNNLVSE